MVKGVGWKKRLLVLASAILVVMTLITIWRFSAQSSGDSSALSGKLAELVANWQCVSEIVPMETLEAILRKLAHGLVYLVLGVGLTGAMIAQRIGLIVLLVPLIGAMLAALDELHQSFAPGRGPSVWDVGIDTLGVVVGMMLVLFLYWCYRRLQREN